MEIHDLNTGTLTSTDYIAIDSGSDTRKIKAVDAISTFFGSAIEILSDVSWTNLLTKKAGVYVINQGAVGSPNDSYYGTMFLVLATSARLIAIATFDDQSAYIFAGTTSSRAWKKITI